MKVKKQKRPEEVRSKSLKSVPPLPDLSMSTEPIRSSAEEAKTTSSRSGSAPQKVEARGFHSGEDGKGKKGTAGSVNCRESEDWFEIKKKKVTPLRRERDINLCGLGHFASERNEEDDFRIRARAFLREER